MPNEKEVIIDTIGEETPIVLIEKEKVVYCITDGVDYNEIYTFEEPVIKDGLLHVVNIFFKSAISQEVLGEQVEENFPLPNGITSSATFKLKEGVLLKEYNFVELDWLSNTETLAREKIKDKIIEKYQQVVPSLIDKIQNIESQIAPGTKLMNL